MASTGSISRWCHPRFAPFLLAAATLGCEGGGVGELLASLVRARFVPSSVTVPRTTSRTVDLEVTCDNDALNTPFGRLGIQVKLDPSTRLPAGITATQDVAVNAQGFATYSCTGASSADLRVAHVNIRVAASSTAPTSATLDALVQVEPLLASDPSKDSTLAQLVISVTATDTTAPVAP